MANAGWAVIIPSVVRDEGLPRSLARCHAAAPPDFSERLNQESTPPTSKVRKLRVKEFEASCPSPPDLCGDAGSQPDTFVTENTTTEAGVHSGPKSESGPSAGGGAGTGAVASQETDAPERTAAGPSRGSHSPCPKQLQEPPGASSPILACSFSPYHMGTCHVPCSGHCVAGP